MITPKKRGAPIGSHNARKEVTADSHLHIRCLSKDKANWMTAAKAAGLSAWVIWALNKTVTKEGIIP